jgi:iduronate 2-sulfatase
MTKVLSWTVGLLVMSAALHSCASHRSVETPTIVKVTKPVMVYLLAGQSNMVGSGTPKADLPIALQSPQADVEFYHSQAPGPLVKNTWVPLQPGSTYDFGPEVTFGRSIADRFPKERVALIKYAAGNTNLAVNWNADTGPYYATFKQSVAAGLMALTDRGDRYKIAGMVWMQGESDASFPAMTAAYEANLTAFIARVRSDLGVPDLPFVIGRIYLGAAHASTSEQHIRKAQVAVAERDSKAAWVDLDGLDQQPVGVEFNGPGTVEMGKRFAEAMQGLRQ